MDAERFAVIDMNRQQIPSQLLAQLGDVILCCAHCKERLDIEMEESLHYRSGSRGTIAPLCYECGSLNYREFCDDDMVPA